MNQTIGISILTNGSRSSDLQRCLCSLLKNCCYRPLVIGITDNGSVDDTSQRLKDLMMSEMYGIEFRSNGYSRDNGCAVGTNSSIKLVSDCELQLHLESDFELLSPEESGIDKMWLHRAVSHLESVDCDYLYLRRMCNERESAMHWWDQWMSQMGEKRGNYVRCNGFWWSNNPVLFRLQALMDADVLPLDMSLDGAKGTPGWSQPELQAGSPPNAWIHQWGMFVHEKPNFALSCECKFGGVCKYGFFKHPNDGAWCGCCDSSKDFTDMDKHRSRYESI